MSRQFLSILLVLCGLVAPSLRAEEPMAPPPTTAARDALLLLRNGQVMRGKITPAGDFYFVTLPTGEIRLRADQVELLANDLEACYQHKRAAIDPSKVNERLDLAQWCILQELYDNAARELSEAAALDSKNARTALIERQLKLTRERPPRNEPAHNDRERVPSNDDLDRLVRGMPPGSVETFSTTIQPLLLNTCATNGCHGSQTNCEMKLVRVQIGKGANRRLTQRNLHNVLQMIDRADPPASRLLTAPIGPHGETGAPIFTSRQAVQYRQLVNWVARVSQGAESELPASVTRPDDKLLQRADIRQWPEAPAPRPAAPTLQNATGAKDASSKLAPAGREGARPRPIDPALQSPAAQAPPAQTKPRAGKQPAAAVVDPLDPAAFNLRFMP